LRHDDTDVTFLMKELKELLCHNTDLKGKIYTLSTIDPSGPSGVMCINFTVLFRISQQSKEFIALIRASNKPEHDSESPKMATMKTSPTDL